MAIASVGTLGTSVSSTSAATLTITTATNALAAGDFAILVVSTDNISTSDGVWNDHRSITNFGGAGYWTKISEQTNTVGGAAGDGVCVSVWLFEATGTVAIGSTCTLTLSAATTDKAASMWKFTKAAGAQIVLDTSPTTNPVNNNTDASNGFGSAAFSGLASAARLYFRGLGKEANSTTALTVSTSFTAITNNRSRNNASAMTVYGEFRVNTSTGETSNPTLAVSGDTAGIFVALIEVTPGDPTTLNDNFDDNSKDATKWGTDGLLTRNGLGTAGSLTEANARTEVTPPTSASGGTGRKSLNYFDMTGKRIYVRVSNTASWPVGEEAYVGCGWNTAHSYVAAIQNGTNVLAFAGDVGTFVAVNGVFTDGMWLGLRHNVSDDTMHVETAPSSENPPVTWTDQAHEARDQRGPIKAVLLGLGAEFWNAGSASPIVVYFDGFNTATTSGTTYNDNLTESAAAAAALANAQTFTSADSETAAAADSADPAGSTFGVTDSESAAAASSAAATQTFVNTDAESVAAADSAAGGLLVTGSVNEAASAADNATTAVTWGATDSESAAANDSLASIVTFNSALSEGATAADSLTAGLVIASADSETSAAAATVTSAQTFANAIAEASGAGDSLSAGLVLAGSLNEAVAAAASATTAVTFSPALSESAAAGDAEASSAVMPNALGEQAGAGDAVSASQVFNETLTESAAAADSADAGGTRTYNEVISESVAASTTLGVGLVVPTFVGESAGAADSVQGASVLQAADSENAAAADSAGASVSIDEAVSEQAAGADSVDGQVVTPFPASRPAARSGHVQRGEREPAIGRGGRIAMVAAWQRHGASSRGSRLGRVSRVGRG